MRFRHIALGCALTGVLGFLAMPPATALADGTGPAPASPRWPAKPALVSKPATPLTKAKPSISVSSPATDNPYGAKVTLTVTLAPTVADRRVALYATPFGKARERVAAGAVNASASGTCGTGSPGPPRSPPSSPAARYNAPNSASTTLDAYARVTDRIAGAYKTSKGGEGTAYDVFHGTGTLTLYSTVAPNSRGDCLEPETEQYDKGFGWDADTKYGCDKLNRESRDAAPFSLSLAVGDRYRIRGDYVAGKDTANLSAQGRWLYFTVTK